MADTTIAPEGSYSWEMGMWEMMGNGDEHININNIVS